MKIFSTIMLIILFAFLLYLTYMNIDVKVNFRYWSGQTIENMPLAFLLPAAVVIGILYAGIIGIVEQLRLRLAIRQLKREKERLQDELRNWKQQAVRAGTVEAPESDLEEAPRKNRRGITPR
jgi:uncharacterized integral membrane protein